MKVKLIQPRMLKRPMDTDLKIRMSPHLGLLTVANIIRHDCEVTIENENIRPIDFDDVPDLVGIAVTDGDTPETFKNTLDWIISQKIDTITSHIVTPYPGTEFYKRMEAQNRIFDHDLSKYNTSHVVVTPLGMSKEELEEGYLWIYQELYSIRNIFRRMPKTIGTIPAYLTFNFFYRRFGRFTSKVCELLTYKRIGLWAEKLSRYM